MRIVISLVVLTLIPLTSVLAENVKLDTDQNRQSYALGHQYGSKLKGRGIDVAPEVLMQGMIDALNSADAQMSPKEIMDAIFKMQQNLAAKEKQAEEEARTASSKKEDVYFSVNKKKAGVIETASGLQYEVLQAGQGASPGPKDTVVVHYRGSLLDGKEFDSSYKRGKPATFQVNRVIAGWQEALQLMKPGAKYRLTIPYRLAYGEKGSPPTIPPAATLLFEVELLAVK